MELEGDFHPHGYVPVHAIRKSKPIRAAAFQARGQSSESGWNEFMSEAMRIWLLVSGKWMPLTSHDLQIA